jgi:tRNA threonylcarbamoyl adenosine modification protein (Sua5/YciO/YrdC/YwlC family)
VDDALVIALSDLETAVDLLRAGEVVAVPTDTVYGLAVSLRVRNAADRLFAKKLRPDTVALPVMVHDLTAALLLAAPRSRDVLRAIGGAFWPGALTAIVQRDEESELGGVVLGGDESTIGLRVPALEMLRVLCEKSGPLGISSANLHGGVPCTDVVELRSQFGDDLVILDGGTCRGRVSTVVDLTGEAPVVLREGEISHAEIAEVLAR